jgi:hypothetical protein
LLCGSDRGPEITIMFVAEALLVRRPVEQRAVRNIRLGASMARAKVSRLVVMGGLLSFALVLTASPAQAALILRLTSGADSITITDGGVGDVNPNAGVITFIGSVGTFLLNVTTGTSTPSTASMDLNSVNVSSTSGGTLLIELTDTDFLATGDGTLRGDVGGTTQGAVQFWAYKCESNEAFCTSGSDAAIHLGPFSSGPFSGSETDGHGPLDPYSMTLVAEIAHTGTQVTTFDFQVQNIPEPAILVLFGLGLGAMAWAGRRRRAKG